MGRFGKWLENKDPKALHELAGDPTSATTPGGDDEAEPVDKNGVKLSAKMENYLTKLLSAMDAQKLSKKKQIAVLERIVTALKGGGMTDQAALATTRNV